MLIGCGDTMLIVTNEREKFLLFDVMFMHIPSNSTKLLHNVRLLLIMCRHDDGNRRRMKRSANDAAEVG